MNRRPPRIVADVEPDRIWRIRLPDGAVREPLNVDHVRSLRESGLASADSGIARVGDDAWQRLGDHPLWSEIAPAPTTARLVVPAAVDVGVIPLEVHAPTPRMQAILDEQRETAEAAMAERTRREDLGRFLQTLAFAAAVAGLICVGDIIVFTCQFVVAFVALLALIRLVALWLVWRVMR